MNTCKKKCETLVLVICIILLVASCSRTHEISGITFESTPIISTAERFALIIDPYISLRDQPGNSGITVSHARRGEIFDISGKRYVSTEHGAIVWFNIGKGWISSVSVQVFSSRSRANTAANSLQ